MTIATGDYLRGGIDLLITAAKPSTEITKPPDPMDNGAVIHFAGYHNVTLTGQEKFLDIVVISLELYRELMWGPYSLGRRGVYTKEEISNLVHRLGYCDPVLQTATREYYNKAWYDMKRTTFIKGMNYQAWEKANRLLSDIRSDRTQNRINNPRKSGQVFPDDMLDMTLGKLMTRINAILNNALHGGQVDQVLNLFDK